MSRLCIRCNARPVREALADERGEQHTVGYLTCQECSGRQHGALCNDPLPHRAPDECSRRSRPRQYHWDLNATEWVWEEA